MSRSVDDLPERMRVEGATDLERRLLDAVALEEPSPELSKRMALAIGIAPPVSTIPPDATAAGTTAAGAGGGTTAVWPLLSVAILGLVTAGVVIGTRGGAGPAHQEVAPPAIVPPPAVLPASTPLPTQIMPALESTPSPSSPPERVATTGDDLRSQIAMIDAARVAIATHAGQRALLSLQRYQAKYPKGSFHPEAAALKVEALMQLGRNPEARILAKRFVAEHGGTPLADRVARIAGLAQP
jgi:hypothetical protein